jgi:hypothetical protein
MKSIRAAFAVALVATVSLAGLANAASAVSQPPAVVTQTEDATQPPVCLPEALARLGLSYTVTNTSDSFVLRVKSAQRFCGHLNVKAAIYEMPGSGQAWPQTLFSVTNFKIREAGVTVITFSKTCMPAQFDVLTGATPRKISPTGPWHGPLLFVGDTRTAHQHMTKGCQVPTTTTTTESTTTTTSTVPETTTSTVPETTTSTVPETTTSSVPTTTTTAVDTTTTVTSETSSTSVVAPPITAPVAPVAAPAELAYTGFNFGLFLAGLTLLALGGILTFTGRRRTA